MDQEWITAADLRARLSHRVWRTPRLEYRLRELAGFGRLAVKLDNAEIERAGVRKQERDWIVPPEFLEPDPLSPSRATFDTHDDGFRSSTGAGHFNAKVRGLGVAFDRAGIEEAFSDLETANMGVAAPTEQALPVAEAVETSVADGNANSLRVSPSELSLNNWAAKVVKEKQITKQHGLSAAKIKETWVSKNPRQYPSVPQAQAAIARVVGKARGRPPKPKM